MNNTAWIKGTKWLRRWALWPLGILLCLTLAWPQSSRALDPSRSLTQYSLRSWTRQYGLPANGINAIAQTSDGYLFLGTPSGLVRFDGVEFILSDFKQEDKIQSPVIWSLAPSRKGGLWAGFNHSSFAYLEAGRVDFRGREDWGGVKLNVVATLEARNGDLWVGAQSMAGRVTASGEFERILPRKDAHETYMEVPAIVEDSQGRIWLGTDGRGLFCWETNRLEKIPQAALDRMNIRSLALDPAGKIWLATPVGVYGYDTDFAAPPIQLALAEPRVLLVDRSGVLWIGTSGQGLVRYRNGELSHLRKADGLTDDSVTSLAEDAEGNLWAGTRNGLNQLSDVQIPTFDQAEGVPGNSKYTVSAALSGGVWVGTSEGFSHIDGKFQVDSYTNQIGSRMVLRALEAHDGKVYLATMDRHVEVFAEGHIVADYRTTERVSALVEDSQGVVAVVGAALYRVTDHFIAQIPYTKATLEPLGTVNNIIYSKDGSYWLAAQEGLFQIKNGEAKCWTADGEQARARAQWVWQDADGTVWAGLTGGIGRLKDGHFRIVTSKDGLFANVIYSMIPDGGGNFWVDSDGGIFRVKRSDLDDFCDGKSQLISCQPFTGLRAVKSADHGRQQFASGCVDLDGRIWFPESQGLVMIDPVRVSAGVSAPIVHIQAVFANGAPVPRDGKTPVPPGRGDVGIAYAGLNYAAPLDTIYRYKLVGYDKDWVLAKDRRFALYTNLKPGHYKFIVTSANAGGDWNPVGDEVDFVLLPHFYQTAWFAALGLGSAAALLAGLTSRRIRLRKEKEAESERVREKLRAEVGRQTEEIAASRAFFQSLVDQLPVGIFRKDKEGRFVFVNRWYCRWKGVTAEQLIGKTPLEFAASLNGNARPEVRAQAANSARHHDEVMATRRQVEAEEYFPDAAQGVEYLHIVNTPMFDLDGAALGSIGIIIDLSQRKKAEQEMEKLNQRLLETSRLAGMAEIAGNVLHNVGNVLNSVNVSAALVMDRARTSNLPNLVKVTELLRSHENDLAQFMTQDEKGRRLPGYLAKLSAHMLAEQKETLKELELLRSNIEHINEIVAMQQNYAKISGVKETVSVDSLVEDSLRMNLGALNRHGVTVSREYQPVPPVEVEKHKVLQILVNLVRNAKYACDESGKADKRLSVRVSNGNGRVKITVADNGVGIPAENLSRIFNYGFTTRKAGHGFGLHSGALAAKELGGSLSVQSDGPGQGAVFILELPATPADAHS